jgi:DnaJ-domain-containing protein 1
MLLLGRILLAGLGMLAGIWLVRTPLGLLGFLLAVYSGHRLIVSLVALGRLALRERGIGRGDGGLGGGFGGSRGARFGGREDPLRLPRQLLTLLYSVAEADGRAGHFELAAIRQFLLQRSRDPFVMMMLAQTRVVALGRDDLVELLRDLRRQLSPQECQSVFTWCALVALIDQRFDHREDAILQLVARHLQIESHEAKLLFHAAKEQAMRSAAAGGSWAGGQGRQGGWGDFRERGPDPATARREALQTLGLDENASAEDIRRRHRELAKKHHPDAHSHLGEVAREEATARFRKIQAAYELLRESA